jgi:hypothetical protein
MNRMLRTLLFAAICCSFMTTANADIAPGTYTYYGGTWSYGPTPLLGPTSSAIFSIEKAGDFKLVGAYQSFDFTAGVLTTTMNALPGDFVLGAGPPSGDTNSDPFLFNVVTSDPTSISEFTLTGSGMLASGHSFNITSVFDGTTTPGTADGVAMARGELEGELVTTVNVVPVPVPGAALLGFLGMGTSAHVLRRKRKKTEANG